MRKWKKDFLLTNGNSIGSIITPPIQCGDFITISELVYDENVRHFLVIKQIKHLYLQEDDVNEILEMDIAILSHYIDLLNELDFCMYYYNTLDDIKSYSLNNKTVISLREIVYGYCETSNTHYYVIRCSNIYIIIMTKFSQI